MDLTKRFILSPSRGFSFVGHEQIANALPQSWRSTVAFLNDNVLMFRNFLDPAVPISSTRIVDQLLQIHYRNAPGHRTFGQRMRSAHWRNTVRFDLPIM
jgi:hypothetical protein